MELECKIICLTHVKIAFDIKMKWKADMEKKKIIKKSKKTVDASSSSIKPCNSKNIETIGTDCRDEKGYFFMIL